MNNDTRLSYFHEYIVDRQTDRQTGRQTQTDRQIDYSSHQLQLLWSISTILLQKK